MLPAALDLEGQLVTQATAAIRKSMERSLGQLQGLLDKFREHSSLLGDEGTDRMFLRQWREHHGERLEEWDDTVAAYKAQEAEILAELPLESKIGIYHINCATIRKKLVDGAHRYAEVWGSCCVAPGERCRECFLTYRLCRADFAPRGRG